MKLLRSEVCFVSVFDTLNFALRQQRKTSFETTLPNVLLAIAGSVVPQMAVEYHKEM